jgi:hypothetical protein
MSLLNQPNHAFTQSWSFYVWIIKIKIWSFNDESQKIGKRLVFWFKNTDYGGKKLIISLEFKVFYFKSQTK